VFFFNPIFITQQVWSFLGLSPLPDPTTAAFSVRDIWNQSDLGFFTSSFTAEVPPTGVVFVVLEPEIEAV
jgi:hypothetical protein